MGKWDELYGAVEKPAPVPVLAGFNANIDRLVALTPSLLHDVREHAVSGEFLSRLIRSMRYCAADEFVVRDPSVFSRISASVPPGTGTFALGGQAAIAAVQVHSLGMGPVTCVVPGAGPRTRGFLEEAGVLPLTFPETGEVPDTVHIIFEHSPGLVPLADRVVPRSNRFIVSPTHDSSTVLIPKSREEEFLKQIGNCRRAFLSGYQFLKTEEEFREAAEQIRAIRGVDSRMRTHVECVSGISEAVLSFVLKHIFPVADSIGLNEQELDAFARVLDPKKPDGIFISPMMIVRDALSLSRATGVPRLHLHTFGYYLAVLKPGTGTPESSRNGLLFAATEVAQAAGGDGLALAREGLHAYADLRAELGLDKPQGVFTVGDRIVVFVPTLISQKVKKTTGLGDVLSSTAFVADGF